MNKLQDVLKSIDSHCSVENKEGYRNLSIGRGEIIMDGFKDPKVMWFLNAEPTYSHVTGRNEVYRKTGEPAISKNRQFARIILQNFKGRHSCMFMNEKVKDFEIINSAHYTNSGREVSNIYVGISEMKDWNYYPTLRNALSSLVEAEKNIEAKRIAEAKVEQELEELKRKQVEQARVLAEQERRRLEEETRKKEEEKRKLAEEIALAQSERDLILKKASEAAAFIRQQVSLKRNPVLDESQDSAKFSNVYNGVAEVINGGPGTGKTTTMIQRLKFLIDKDDIEDYIENNNDCHLSKSQLEVIASSADKWIYFSPTDLLKRYLQDNMSYEGLPKAIQRTNVWKDFLKNAVRDEYHLAGQDCPFEFAKRRLEDAKIFKGNHIAIIENFSDYYLQQVKDKFMKISKTDTSKFEWKILGSIITRECAKIESITNIKDLVSFLVRLEGIDKNIVVGGKTIKSGLDITSEFNADIKDLTDECVALLKRDSDKYNEVIEYIKTLEKHPSSDADDIDDTDDVEQDYGDLNISLHNKMKALLKKLCLKIRENNVKLTTAQKGLYELVRDYVSEELLTILADSAYFVKHIQPTLRGSDHYALSCIPQYYRAYRKGMPERHREHWDVDILAEIVDQGKNKPLLCQEQSLLVGFINNIIKTLYVVSKDKFRKSTHKYNAAYANLCSPVIGVDEATDYSLIEFYGIKSFGHHEVCSYTLSGDIMQLMKDDGIRDWRVLNHPLLFENLDVHNLNISYRQSAELLALADKIYQIERGVPSPYECFLKESDTPTPLWFENDDIDNKAEWISERVIEITKLYSCVPTIAIFAKDKKRAEELKEALDECDNLVKAGIQVKVCSDNTLEGEKTLRIFPIDQVKGLEFEAVFFYDIDEIEETSLINRYLYVGISRASMCLAVTSNGKSDKITDMLRQYFKTGVTW